MVGAHSVMAPGLSDAGLSGSRTRLSRAGGVEQPRMACSMSAGARRGGRGAHMQESVCTLVALFTRLQNSDRVVWLHAAHGPACVRYPKLLYMRVHSACPAMLRARAAPRQRWGRPHAACLAVRPSSPSYTLKVQTAVRHEHAASLRHTLCHLRLICHHASGHVALGPRQLRASVQGAGAHFWVCCEMDGG